MNNTVHPVCVGDYVEITLWSDPSKYSKGSICEIVKNGSVPTVILQNGDKGNVHQILNSEEKIKERIMSEGQYSENKEIFGEEVMRSKVIPQTVQSFLNSDGGYLYIGIRDVGGPNERLIGLDRDFKMIANHEDKSSDKLRDDLEREIMDSLEKYLKSDASLGSLVKIRFVLVCGVEIVEIIVKKSLKPWFYKHISKSNKLKQFEIHWNDKILRQQFMDDFYIRRGGSKKLLESHEDFYIYAKDRFANSWSKAVEL